MEIHPLGIRDSDFLTGHNVLHGVNMLGQRRRVDIVVRIWAAVVVYPGYWHTSAWGLTEASTTRFLTLWKYCKPTSLSGTIIDVTGMPNVVRIDMHHLIHPFDVAIDGIMSGQVQED